MALYVFIRLLDVLQILAFQSLENIFLDHLLLPISNPVSQLSHKT